MNHTDRPATGRVRARAHHVLGILAAAATLICLALGLTFWIWLADWRFAATGVLGLLVGIVCIGASQPKRPSRTPQQAAVDNAISAALIEHYGFLPLTTRYGAASLAREHVEAWKAGESW